MHMKVSAHMDSLLASVAAWGEDDETQLWQA